GVGAACSIVGLVWYYFTPKFWVEGYMPTQPHSVPGQPYTGNLESGFSHQIHAGKLGMDCRYCHTHIEESPEANIPNVATCYGCHADQHVRDENAKPENVAFI